MSENQSEIKSEPRRWFRFYAESVNDPKVQRLPAHLFKTWVNLLCLASSNGGTLPNREDIAFQLRMSDHDAQSQIDELIGLGLLDIASDKTLEPHNWKARQYVSDTSKTRTRKYRDKLKRASDSSGDVTVTPPDTEQITDTETDSRERDVSPPAFNEASENLIQDAARWMGADRHHAVKWLTSTISASSGEAVMAAYAQLLESQTKGKLIADPIRYIGKTAPTLKASAAKPTAGNVLTIDGLPFKLTGPQNVKPKLEAANA